MKKIQNILYQNKKLMKIEEESTSEINILIEIINKHIKQKRQRKLKCHTEKKSKELKTHAHFHLNNHEFSQSMKTEARCG